MYNPYNRGRWYRVNIKSDGSALTLDGDIDCAVSGTYIKFPKGLHIVDCKYDLKSVPHSGNAVIAIDVMSYPDGCQGIARPLPAAMSEGYVYVFGYFE